MKNLTINISESDFARYNFQQETLSFDELVEKIKSQLIQSTTSKSKVEDTPAFNMWKDRNDMEEVESYVERLRRKPRQHINLTTIS